MSKWEVVWHNLQADPFLILGGTLFFILIFAAFFVLAFPARLSCDDIAEQQWYRYPQHQHEHWVDRRWRRYKKLHGHVRFKRWEIQRRLFNTGQDTYLPVLEEEPLLRPNAPHAYAPAFAPKVPLDYVLAHLDRLAADEGKMLTQKPESGKPQETPAQHADKGKAREIQLPKPDLKSIRRTSSFGIRLSPNPPKIPARRATSRSQSRYEPVAESSRDAQSRAARTGGDMGVPWYTASQLLPGPQPAGKARTDIIRRPGSSRGYRPRYDQGSDSISGNMESVYEMDELPSQESDINNVAESRLANSQGAADPTIWPQKLKSIPTSRILKLEAAERRYSKSTGNLIELHAEAMNNKCATLKHGAAPDTPEISEHAITSAPSPKPSMMLHGEVAQDGEPIESLPGNVESHAEDEALVVATPGDTETRLETAGPELEGTRQQVSGETPSERPHGHDDSAEPLLDLSRDDW